MTCPYCQNTKQQIKAGRNKSGSQRYKCKVCNRHYTPEPKENGYPESIRQQAVRMYVDGMTLRRIARHLGVKHQRQQYMCTGANWLIVDSKLAPLAN